jgi:hypothetical protein
MEGAAAQNQEEEITRLRESEKMLTGQMDQMRQAIIEGGEDAANMLALQAELASRLASKEKALKDKDKYIDELLQNLDEVRQKVSGLESQNRELKAHQSSILWESRSSISAMETEVEMQKSINMNLTQQSNVLESKVQGQLAVQQQQINELQAMLSTERARVTFLENQRRALFNQLDMQPDTASEHSKISSAGPHAQEVLGEGATVEMTRARVHVHAAAPCALGVDSGPGQNVQVHDKVAFTHSTSNNPSSGTTPMTSTGSGGVYESETEVYLRQQNGVQKNADLLSQIGKVREKMAKLQQNTNERRQKMSSSDSSQLPVENADNPIVTLVSQNIC